ncbi:nucleolin-like [Pontoporia blainvillei]|uniref:Serine/arginine-rich splicing factor 2 n=1 Tax=Pontoporia blainvillei TaxID=48723 RepID=A0ABX0SC74_PONBL|nr:nucleolin-like [Pontoporia blainvillei]
MVKLAKASKNQGDPKKMAPPPKEVEDSEDEEMSENEEDDSSGEEAVIPQKKGRKATATPAKKMMVSPTKKVPVGTPAKKAVVTPGKKAAAMPAKKTVTPAKAVATPGKRGAAAPAKGAKNGKNGKNAKKEDSDEKDEDDSEGEDEDEFEEEEELVKAAPGKRKKEMAKQEAAPEAKKQKVEATEATTSFKLFAGNLNFSKSAPEWKTGITDLFAKNGLAVVDVRIGVSRKFGHVDFESAEDLEKALELTGLKVFGNEIKPEKPKGKDSLSEDTTEETLKESFDGPIRARIVTDRETGSSKGFGFVDFNSEEDAKAAKEAVEDGEIDGNTVTLDWAKPKG